ncbi:hypothetical protein J6590_057765 [Homalodisca vitripennis]|nr:hypothetical protein J6590_057765 [Homalodisca vitripennis]
MPNYKSLSLPELGLLIPNSLDREYLVRVLAALAGPLLFSCSPGKLDTSSSVRYIIGSRVSVRLKVWQGIFVGVLARLADPLSCSVAVQVSSAPYLSVTSPVHVCQSASYALRGPASLYCLQLYRDRMLLEN